MLCLSAVLPHSISMKLLKNFRYICIGGLNRVLLNEYYFHFYRKNMTALQEFKVTIYKFYRK
jgi:hypothetical protein